MDGCENIKSGKNIEKSIESLYILKYIFSFLSEKQKLKIIIYNKDLQKKLDINIDNYKRIRGIYRVIERNGKGKEFNIYGELEFEGEYLSGKKYGKGKEYYGKRDIYYIGIFESININLNEKKYFQLKFEGEFWDDKRWNGKGYNINGKVKYILKNGNGYVEEYIKDMKFEGEYLKGEKNGNGKEYYFILSNFNFFEYNGENNVEKKKYKKCKIYEGEYLNGKSYGK